MTKSSRGLRPKRSVHIASPEALALDRAVMSVMLGSPPGAVAAELGCSVPVLMRRVKARRRQLRQAVRAERPVPVAAPMTAAVAPATPAAVPSPASPPQPRRARGADRGAERMWTADRPVAPENSALVAAAYRRAAVDYSGRPTRSAPATRFATPLPADAPEAAIIDQALRRAYADLLAAR